MSESPPRPVGAPGESRRGRSGKAQSRWPRRVWIVAGGTGGHIYPGLALGEALLEDDPSIQVRYCCGRRPIELEIYKTAGVEPLVLPIEARRRGLPGMLGFARDLIRAQGVASAEARGWKPDLAVGFGSYLSVPAIRAARSVGASIVLHEQNAKAGLANRLLSRYAELVLLGLEEAGPSFKGRRVRWVGNPVRAALIEPVDRARARAVFGLPEQGLVCLCFGGSQGAAALNRLMIDIVGSMEERSATGAEGWTFLWATGKNQFDSVRDVLGSESAGAARVKLVPYLDRMDLAYGAADLVIARAGAITLAELAALGKAAILIPLPTSAGGHQQANAKALASAGAAIAIDERDPGAVKKIETLLLKWRESYDKLHEMGEAARRRGSPGAARSMVEAIRSLAPSER